MRSNRKLLVILLAQFLDKDSKSRMSLCGTIEGMVLDDKVTAQEANEIYSTIRGFKEEYFKSKNSEYGKLFWWPLSQKEDRIEYIKWILNYNPDN